MKDRTRRTCAEAPRESDGVIVPKRLPNKRDPALEEAKKERTPAKRNANEEPAGCTQRQKPASSGLEGVRRRAMKDKHCQFTALLHHITPALLRESFYELKRNAAPGIDGVRWHDYEKQLEDRLPELHADLHKGSYRAKPVLRTYIKKSNGKHRPLGKTCVEDKLVQQAVSKVLQAIYEADFKRFSYGFRSNKSQHDALDALSTAIIRRKVNWILDADIQGFFDTIPHEMLFLFLEKRISDKRILRLIRKWLKTGYSEDGQVHSQENGTPQGSVISPLLANIYLHYVLDEWLNEERKQASGLISIIRYADDFILGFQYKGEAQYYLKALRERLREYGLTLHPEKTRLLEFGRYAEKNRKERGEGKPETFDFLGFTHICSRSTKGRYWVKRITKRQKLKAKVCEVSRILKQNIHRPIHETGKWLGMVVRGFGNYYGVHGNSRALNNFRRLCIESWMKTLRRRSHKGRNFSWERMQSITEHYIPHLRICHEYPEVRFDART